MGPMVIPIKVTGAVVHTDLRALIEQLSEEDLHLVADAVATRDIVIKYVVQQVLDGATDLGSWAGRVYHPAIQPQTGLDWACREIACRSSTVAASEIARLCLDLEAARAENDQLREVCARLEEQVTAAWR